MVIFCDLVPKAPIAPRSPFYPNRSRSWCRSQTCSPSQKSLCRSRKEQEVPLLVQHGASAIHSADDRVAPETVSVLL